MINYKIEKKRIVISINGNCPYSCDYCYRTSKDFVKFPRKSSLLILEDIAKLNGDFQIIQLGSDTEPFLQEEEAIKLIKGLANLGKNISFATKKGISQGTINELADIYGSMNVNSNQLVGLVSLIGFDAAKKLEPNAPSPKERIKTLERLYQAKIPVFVYIKPMLPIVGDKEIQKIISETHDISEGYIMGYFITDNPEKAKSYGFGKSERKKMNWLLDKRSWYYYEDPRIKELLSKKNSFFTSVDAINFIIKQRIL